MVHYHIDLHHSQTAVKEAYEGTIGLGLGLLMTAGQWLRR